MTPFSNGNAPEGFIKMTQRVTSAYMCYFMHYWDLLVGDILRGCDGEVQLHSEATL
jgi:hypothetical protein